jgi:hypothetical protein
VSQVGSHSKLTAYAGWRKKDPALAKRAWKEFLAPESWPSTWYTGEIRHIKPPAVLSPVDEAPGVETNDAAQWSLAAIANLALVPEALPAQ